MLNVVQFVMWIYGYVLIAAAIISFVPDFTTHPIGMFISRLTEPYMRLFQRFIPSVQMGSVSVNLSYLVGMVVYFVIQRIALGVLTGMLAMVIP